MAGDGIGTIVIVDPEVCHRMGFSNYTSVDSEFPPHEFHITVDMPQRVDEWDLVFPSLYCLRDSILVFIRLQCLHDIAKSLAGVRNAYIAEMALSNNLTSF